MLRYAQPRGLAFGDYAAAREARVKVPDARDADAARALRRHYAAEAHELGGQLRVEAAQLFAEFRKIFVGEPEAEAGAEIVVARNFVVEAQTLRAFAGKPGGYAFGPRAEAPPQLVARAAQVIRAAELEPFHRAPRAAPPAESASARYFAASSGSPAASRHFAQLRQAAA